jgi:hypothetical protein
MNKRLLFIFILTSCISVQAQIAYSGGHDVRAARNPEFAAIQVFPNPAVEFFNITPNPNIEHIAVYNLLGRQMKSFTYSDSDRYYVGDLPKGMYLVQMSGRDSRLISTQRLSKR